MKAGLVSSQPEISAGFGLAAASRPNAHKTAQTVWEISPNGALNYPEAVTSRFSNSADPCLYSRPATLANWRFASVSNLDQPLKPKQPAASIASLVEGDRAADNVLPEYAPAPQIPHCRDKQSKAATASSFGSETSVARNGVGD